MDWWLRHQICNREVISSCPVHYEQVRASVHMQLPPSPSSIIWHWPKRLTISGWVGNCRCGHALRTTQWSIHLRAHRFALHI